MAPSTSDSPFEFQIYSPGGIAVSFGIFLALATLYIIGTAIYNVFFHPLKHIPGPFLARACGFPYAIHMRNGSMVPWIKAVHEKYGHVVRLAPTEVSFISGETAWPDIYGFRVGKYKNTGAYLKDRAWFPKPVNGVWTILAANETDHTRLRRNLSHAFSDKALRDQEPIIQQYSDLLVQRMHEHAADAKPIDMARWYNFLTFDVINDLTFGEPLYCLRDGNDHLWIQLVIATVKAIGLLAIRAKYPIFDYYDRMKNLFKNSGDVGRMRLEFFALAQKKVQNRLDTKEERPDFFNFIIKNQGSEAKKLTRGEMDSNSIVLLAAGSETTATTLSGTSYFLCKPENKAAYTKVVNEVRSRFSSASEITIEEANKLEYMIACLQEGLRHYPPVATGFPRIVPKGGDTISGQYIPEGTSVYVSQHAMNTSARNWKDPEAFVPERWLGDEKYKDDNRDSFNPFSFGPRNCLGKNLAYAEMRLTMAKILYNFDLELLDKGDEWLKRQKLLTLWVKSPLMFKLHPVKR